MGQIWVYGHALPPRGQERGGGGTQRQNWVTSRANMKQLIIFIEFLRTGRLHELYEKVLILPIFLITLPLYEYVGCYFTVYSFKSEQDLLLMFSLMRLCVVGHQIIAVILGWILLLCVEEGTVFSPPGNPNSTLAGREIFQLSNEKNR
jgi:hypothetical protein